MVYRLSDGVTVAVRFEQSDDAGRHLIEFLKLAAMWVRSRCELKALACTQLGVGSQ